MSATWGNKIKYTIFGESHGEGIGIVIDNLPPGLALDFGMINSELMRRSPGNSEYTTARKEQDEFEILSGYFNGKTTGAPLCAFIKNTDTRSKDYESIKDLLRPSHADYTGFIKFKGFHDYRGGGHFSGRLTAAIVLAGAIAKQLLKLKNITIISHIYKIGTFCDKPFNYLNINESNLSNLQGSLFPTLDLDAGVAMQQEISKVKSKGDSIGGIIEAAVTNLPAGVGSPFFDSLESVISHLIFSIPGVKGVEFGTGFSFSEMLGSQANDQFEVNDCQIKTTTNHNGGILGGISTGMPLIFKAVFKPTASIAIEQKTVNINNKQSASLNITGRHDPCIVPRAVPVIECAAAMAVLDLID